ncbi:MAG: 16S rRNA (adenine(1518)-N(6)/adenine(1519)-N(6))-dimethyltransferase RsmA [Bryobacteraceae bacterium]
MGRRFGQHFLARKSILNRIAEAACADSPETVIEIGPGKGALTECLLEYPGRVVAIEVDTVLVHYLRQKFRDAVESGKLQIIEGDILKAELAPLGKRPVIAGNLPYYITSPILDKVFALEGQWQRAVFLVQAEVAERITADPGSRDFGYLSVLAQIHSHAENLFPVSKEAFRPPPKVESAVIRLIPRDAAAEMGIRDVPGFLKFAQVCFRQKRKTLRNNLAPVYGTERVDALPEAKQRAEQLSLEQLVSIHEKLQ